MTARACHRRSIGTSSDSIRAISIRGGSSITASGSLAQFRESFFINCWQLFREETCEMWKAYGADGVAVCSRFGLLKDPLESCDGRPHLGRVRYGPAHITGWNVQRFISTKRMQYAHEREVRAALWILDPFAELTAISISIIALTSVR